LSRIKIFLVVFVASVASLIVFGYFREGVTYFSLGVSFGLVALSFVIVRYISKHSQTVAIKGDNLILNSMNHKSSVMPIRCVKSAKTRRFLGSCFTTLHYTMDGRSKWVFMITKNCENNPDIVLMEAKDSSKKNKKANHKPGSVITQQA